MSLMGRCLTVLWEVTVEVLPAREMVFMPEMLHFVLKVREQALLEGGKWKMAEVNLLEVFPDIRRDDILRLLDRIAKELIRRKYFRGVILFSIASSGIRKLDNY